MLDIQKDGQHDLSKIIFYKKNKKKTIVFSQDSLLIIESLTWIIPVLIGAIYHSERR
jgi:glycine cleavage system H lipoate-binding protein